MADNFLFKFIFLLIALDVWYW